MSLGNKVERAPMPPTHLGRYCDEFSYRFNRRHSQEEMFGETVKGLLNGKPLQYKRLTA
jgi:hypothetical protein